MFKIATVCSGIGSPEQYLKDQNIPHEISFACEIDKYARQTYLANFQPGEMYTDMTKENWDKPEQYADIFIGGIPCQAFSLAGKRLGELDPRGLLFYDFYRYVKNQQPKVFIIENVKGLLSDNNGSTFQNWVQLLGQSMNTHLNMFNHPDSLMYNLHFKVLNSKDFGVPQNRERVFLVGVRNDLPNTFRFPPGFRLTKRLKDILEPEVDEKYYLSDSAFKYITNPVRIEKKFTQINGEIACTLTAQGNTNWTGDFIQEPELIKAGQLAGPHESSGRVYSIDGLSPTVTAKQGGGHEPYIEVGVGYRYGTHQQDTLHYEDGIMSTLTAGSKGNAQHFTKVLTNQRIRRLTPLECMRLQGFPDSYIKPCSDSQTYKQAGNSITTFVIGAVMENLMNVLQEQIKIAS